MDMVDTPWLFKSFLLQNGCDIINSENLEPLFSTPQGIQAAEFWEELIDEKAMPVGMHQIAETRFLGGNLGFYLGSSSRLGKWFGNTSFEFGVAFLPGEMRRAIPIGGAVLVLFPKNKTEDDAAWDFIKWITSPDIVAEFSIKTGYVPTRKSSLKLPEMEEFFNKNPMYKVAFEQLEYGFSYWHFEAMGTIDSMIAQKLEEIERGVYTPKNAMITLTEELKLEIIGD